MNISFVKSLTIKKHHSFRRYLYYVSVALLLLLCACNPTKKLTEGELLLERNIVTYKTSSIDKKDVEAYIKQKPNKKVLFWKFHLYLYNSVNTQKLERKRMKKLAKRGAINNERIEKNKIFNEERKANGKEPKQVKLKSTTPFMFRGWLLSIGEPPVIYDSSLTKKSARQVQLFFENKGFFNCTVKDSVSTKRKKVTVRYYVQEGNPYRINHLSYDIKDTLVKYYVFLDSTSSLIRGGMRYDADVLQAERDRITNNLRNDGYFYFAKEYIYFEVDSSIGYHKANITLGIKNMMIKSSEKRDSIIEQSHKKYNIGNIYIYADYDPKFKNSFSDTTHYRSYNILSSKILRYKPRAITNAVFLYKNDLYQQKNADLTYNRLSALRIFRSVQIQFFDVGKNTIDCYIYLTNMPKKSLTIQSEIINTSATNGIAGSLIFQNKNTFKGGEIFEVRLRGSAEIQKAKQEKQQEIFSTIESPIPFNTLEIGSELNLNIPRFVTPLHIHGKKSNNAKTNITSMYNYQRRPDFGRSIANVAYGYSWSETSTKKHLFNPIEFNLVKVFNLSSAILQAIDSGRVKDLFLKNSYSDHITLGSRYSYVFTNQDISKQKDFSYLRVGVESAGSLLRSSFNLIDRYLPSVKLQYKDESYMIDSIPFAQYLRLDADFRYYKLLNETNKLVYRAAFGIGKPLYNLRVLPLEKSFFAGGPNDIRAWQARTLGPGGYNDTTGSAFADKIGDIKIEGNIEYRFNIIKMLNAALFVDAGNIWLRKPYPSYPVGDFEFNKFLWEIAIGTGIGLRVDFTFFIIRLDVGIKIKDPALPEGNRWTFGKKPLNDPVFNFGIGYPF